jgi:hypothetical protein
MSCDGPAAGGLHSATQLELRALVPTSVGQFAWLWGARGSKADTQQEQQTVSVRAFWACRLVWSCILQHGLQGGPMPATQMPCDRGGLLHCNNAESPLTQARS